MSKLYTLSDENIEEIVKIQDHYFNVLKLTPPKDTDLVRALLKMGVSNFWENETKRAKEKTK